MERSLTSNIMNTLLDDVSKNFQQFNNTVTDDVLLSLYGIFDKILYNALELIETNSVTILRLKNSPSIADEILQVTNQGSSYVLFHRVNYCQCVFYLQKVVHAKAYPACKHFIAANLAYIWNKYRTFDVDLNNFQIYINNIQESALK